MIAKVLSVDAPRRSVAVKVRVSVPEKLRSLWYLRPVAFNKVAENFSLVAVTVTDWVPLPTISVAESPPVKSVLKVMTPRVAVNVVVIGGVIPSRSFTKLPFMKRGVAAAVVCDGKAAGELVMVN